MSEQKSEVPYEPEELRAWFTRKLADPYEAGYTIRVTIQRVLDLLGQHEARLAELEAAPKRDSEFLFAIAEAHTADLSNRIAELERRWDVTSGKVERIDNAQRTTATDASIAADNIEDFGARIAAAEARIKALEKTASQPAPVKDVPSAPAQEARGLYRKYTVLHGDGSPAEGEYFVLKMTDQYARVALRAYAVACETENPKLAADLYAFLGATQPKPIAEGEARVAYVNKDFGMVDFHMDPEQTKTLYAMLKDNPTLTVRVVIYPADEEAQS